MFADHLAEAIGRAHGAALDNVTRALWAAVSAEQIGEDQALHLSEAINARRMLGKAAQAAAGRGFLPVRLTPPRKHQRPPERSLAIERRRRLAASGRMPPKIAAHFTGGEQAALAVVAVEVAKRNACTLAIGAIAAIAGVSETTVRRALRQAKALGFVTVKERRLSRFRSETNVVAIVSSAWASWLRLARHGSGCQSWKGTNTRDLERDCQWPSKALKEAAGRQGFSHDSGLRHGLRRLDAKEK